MISISPIHKIVSFRKAKNMERKESYKSCGTISGSSDVEYQALLAELKQKDKQREELLMNLKVCLNFYLFAIFKQAGSVQLKAGFVYLFISCQNLPALICFETALDMFCSVLVVIFLNLFTDICHTEYYI